MVGLEFYLFEDELWCKTNDGKNFIVDENKKELIRYLLEQIRNHYPEAYSALCDIYSKSALNNEYYQYLMVRRFCKCNFCRLDTTSMDIEDVDHEGKFNFEKVECPLRGECSYEGIVCCPRFNSNLSQAELRTMKLLYKGLSVENTAKELFLSPNTVRQHMKSVYVKLGVHKISEFIKYANDKNMFN
mgnify:CR=1 FL=1